MISREEALEYHSQGRHGKIEVVSTKPCKTQKDLSLAYTPGVAEPCREIEKDPSKAYEYTAKDNLVAVISNGTAVLGLGDIGALAGKPVMEGKGVLFKRFADIDVFDIELDTHDPEEFIQAVKLMEPTFGGINLEDIKAPECFIIEERLKEEMGIPVFHDDQHGTAIISGAGLLNAAELVGKNLEDLKVVFNGAGAAGIACAKFYIALGVSPENVLLCDSNGVIYKGRTDRMNKYKAEFAVETSARTLADALVGADVFAGLSVAGCVTKEMVRTMADRPIIFAMANPDPEITYQDALDARDDLIMATGRSDFPNQVNNVLGFPFIFRGALDVRASAINDEMKIAAARALANLTREPVPYQVEKVYGGRPLRFGTEYIIPKPFDPRVLIWEASAVAQAAIETGVAKIRIDVDEYREMLEARLGLSRKVMRVMINKARMRPKHIVYPEGEQVAVLKACEVIADEGMARPVLLGNRDRICALAEEVGLDIDDRVDIVDPSENEYHESYVREFHKMRARDGVTVAAARDLMKEPGYFGAMMVRMGDADGMVTGLTKGHAEALRPATEIIGTSETGIAAGMQMIATKDAVYFLADVSVNACPTAEELADIAVMCANEVRRFEYEPRIAMVSHADFGQSASAEAAKMRRAVELVRERAPGLAIDGEMRVDTALDTAALATDFPFATLEGQANILIFPNIDAANAALGTARALGGADGVGPILLGMSKSIQIMPYGGFNEADVINMTALAVVNSSEGSD